MYRVPRIAANFTLIGVLCLVLCGCVRQANAQTTVSDTKTTALQPDATAHLYVFGLGLGLGVGGAMSWKFYRTWTGRFQSLNEGWFGHDTYAGGSDKIGHFYTDFVLLRGFHHVYRAHNYDDVTSIWYAFAGSMITRSVMEIADGYTTFKFSMQDLIANTLGSLTSMGLLFAPAWDKTIGFSWTYMSSQEKLDGEVDQESIDNDYNGSTYHLDIKLKGLVDLIEAPGFTALDPYTVGVSYYTRGYDRERPQKDRMVGLTFGLNLAELWRANSAPDNRWAGYGQAIVRYFKLPFTFAGYYWSLDRKFSGFRYGLTYNY